MRMAHPAGNINKPPARTSTHSAGPLPSVKTCEVSESTKKTSVAS